MGKHGISWDIATSDGQFSVTFTGEINEAVNFDLLLTECKEKQLKGDATFNLEGVTRINSFGVRQWVNFMRAFGELDGVGTIYWERCSVPIVTQINMIKDFHGRAQITSFYAPYANEESGDEDNRLLLSKDLTDPHEAPTFEEEDGLWELDEEPDNYFTFLFAKE